MSPHETVRNLGQFRLDYCCMPQERDDRGGRRGCMRSARRGGDCDAQGWPQGRSARRRDCRRPAMQKFISKTDQFQGGKGPETIGKLV